MLKSQPFIHSRQEKFNKLSIWMPNNSFELILKIIQNFIWILMQKQIIRRIHFWVYIEITIES